MRCAMHVLQQGEPPQEEVEKARKAEKAQRAQQRQQGVALDQAMIPAMPLSEALMACEVDAPNGSAL